MSLVGRVLAEAPRALVLTAPAGYGKSTFVREYAQAFPRAAFCDCEGAHDGDGLARAIADALAAGSPELELEVARARLAQAATSGELAVDLWSRSVEGADLFVFENADALREIGAARELLERLAVAAPAGRVLAFCARHPLPAALSRAIGRERVVTVEAEQLRLAPDAVVALAAEYGVGEREAREVARLSEGWPMVSRLLLDLAAVGRLAQLADGLDDVAFEELYDYLADAVVTALPGTIADALMIAAAVPGATLDELRLALGERFDALVERRLLALPFVAREGAGYAVHPLVRAMLAARYPERMGDAAERALAAHEERGNGVRAAHIALGQGDARRAARLLDRLPTYLRTSTALPACEQIVSQLGPALIAQYPNLWIATIPFRRYAVDLGTYVREARTVYYCLPVASEPQLRL
ncbi:MAG: LuxR family transcriptional regulator, maltose regulon positive regulatory protein, partial [Candidatus Eremiobacteraeota bacterium]|nr:LuxR family transcriptional regulator, maltose regulon positive regulatory protein [Candidatus Eremiobacteraeota bacterium]